MINVVYYKLFILKYYMLHIKINNIIDRNIVFILVLTFPLAEFLVLDFSIVVKIQLNNLYWQGHSPFLSLVSSLVAFHCIQYFQTCLIKKINNWKYFEFFYDHIFFKSQLYVGCIYFSYMNVKEIYLRDFIRVPGRTF